MSPGFRNIILINGKAIKTEDILNKKVATHSAFETDIFNFCNDLLSKNPFINFYSSGSTGKPREIRIKKDQIIASIYMTAGFFNLKAGDNSLLCIPVANTGGKMMLARALELNLELECVEPAGNPFLNIRRIPDFVALVPMQLSSIIKNDKTLAQLNKVKNIIVGGAPVGEKLLEEIQQIQPPVYATYGMTETVSHVALKLLNTANRRNFFNILPGIEINVDDRDCLKIKGAVTDHKWIQTNDRVRLIDQQRFEWIGRLDLIINSGGYKIQPEKVEETINKIMKDLDLERRFFVYGLPHEQLGQECVLFIEGETLREEDLINISTQLNTQLHSFEKPKKTIFIPEFYETASGKIDRINTAEAPDQ